MLKFSFYVGCNSVNSNYLFFSFFPFFCFDKCLPILYRLIGLILDYFVQRVTKIFC